MYTDGPVPGRYAEDEARDAFDHGAQDADRAHAHSEAYRLDFPPEVTDVPHRYADGEDGPLCMAYRDGYAQRASELTEGTEGTDA